ncbi:MAG: O-antigen ligase family protein, partial [Pirellulales bacterium]|nr:O-antigen ligase family protein [Pirellulales bacterium]
MNLLVGMFSLAALVWLVPVIRRGGVIPIGIVVLLVGTVLGPAFFAIEGPIQFSLDRVLWAGMLGVLAVRWRMGQLSCSRIHRVDGIMIGLATWLLISTQLGGAVAEGTPPMARWLFYIAMPLGMYAISRWVGIGSFDVRLFMSAMTVLGLYLAFTAMCEVTGIHALVFPRYIIDSDTWEFFGRGRGPLLNPAGNGILMSISLAAAIIGFLHSQRRGKLLYGVAILILLGGIYATLTRSVWLGAGAAVSILAMVHAPRWVRVLGMAVVVLLGGAMMTGLKDQLIRLKRDKHLTAADAEKSIQLRPLLAVVAWEMFKDRPLNG